MFDEAMDVGIVTAPLDFGPSGPGVYLENLCLALRDLGNDDLDLHLIHYQKSSNEIYTDANDVILPRTPCRFESAIASLDLDVLHYNYIPYKRPLVFALDVPLVITIHGDLPFVLPEQTPWQRRYVGKPIQQLYSKVGLLDQIDHFLAVSDSVRENVRRGLSLPGRKMTTVYSGVDDRFKPVDDADETVRATFGIKPPYLLNVNNYMEKKNRTTLIRAFARVRGEHPDLTLVLAGGGWEESDLGATIAEHGLSDAVHDLGFVQERYLPSLYSAARALVNPTLHETFGLTNVEAMACGCPVVTSERFAVPEIVDDAALFIADPLDADAVAATIETLLGDEDRRDELSRAALSRAATFSWERTATETIRVYRQVLQD